MDRHPIGTLMTATMENLRDMIDVNTVVGEAVHTPDGATLIPISRVSFGFVAGGGEIAGPNPPRAGDGEAGDLPFAGGAGAGVTVSPLGFLVECGGQVRLLPAQFQQPLERILEQLPQALAALKDAARDDPSPAEPEA